MTRPATDSQSNMPPLCTPFVPRTASTDSFKDTGIFTLGELIGDARLWRFADCRSSAPMPATMFGQSHASGSHALEYQLDHTAAHRGSGRGRLDPAPAAKASTWAP